MGLLAQVGNPCGPPLIIEDRQIEAVRIRLGRFGRPVVQVRRAAVCHRIVGPPPDGVTVVPWGLSQWHDANRDDAIELAQFIAGLQDKG